YLFLSLYLTYLQTVRQNTQHTSISDTYIHTNTHTHTHTYARTQTHMHLNYLCCDLGLPALLSILVQRPNTRLCNHHTVVHRIWTQLHQSTYQRNTSSEEHQYNSYTIN